MRGSNERSGSLFSYVDLEARARRDHSLRTIREISNAALTDLSGAFTALSADFGRAPIAPEKLLRAMLSQAFDRIRSERKLMERLEFDLLFRWFVGVDDWSETMRLSPRTATGRLKERSQRSSWRRCWRRGG